MKSYPWSDMEEAREGLLRSYSIRDCGFWNNLRTGGVSNVVGLATETTENSEFFLNELGELCGIVN